MTIRKLASHKDKEIQLRVDFPSLSTRPPGAKSNLTLIGLIRWRCRWAIARSEIESSQNLSNIIIWKHRQQKVVTSSEWCRQTRSLLFRHFSQWKWNWTPSVLYNFFALNQCLPSLSPQTTWDSSLKLSGLVRAHCHWATGRSRVKSSQNSKTLTQNPYSN